MSRTVHHTPAAHRASTRAQQAYQAEHVAYLYPWMHHLVDARDSWHELWDIRYPTGKTPRKIRRATAVYGYFYGVGTPLDGYAHAREVKNRTRLRNWRHGIVKYVNADPEAAYDVPTPQLCHRHSALWDAI